MKFSFSSEQEEFRSNLRRFLANRSPTNEVRRLMATDDGYERDGWRSAPDNPQWANELCGACRKDLFDQGFRAFCVSTRRLRHPIKPAPR